MREKNIQFQIPFRKFVVLKLMEPFTGYEKNVTTDNFFTNVSLATKLAKNIIIVGIIRGNKRELLAKEQKEKMTLFSIFKKIIFFLQCVKMN